MVIKEMVVEERPIDIFNLITRLRNMGLKPRSIEFIEWRSMMTTLLDDRLIQSFIGWLSIGRDQYELTKIRIKFKEEDYGR